MARPRPPHLSDLCAFVPSAYRSSTHTNHYGVGIAGVSDIEAAAHDRAQTRQHVVGSVIDLAGADRGGQLSFVREAQVSQRGGDVVGRLVEQFAFDDAQHVRGDAGMEVELACVGEPTVGPSGRAHVVVQKLRHDRDEFGRGGPTIESTHLGPPPSSRSSTSHSVSATRRPIAASSTDGV